MFVITPMVGWIMARTTLNFPADVMVDVSLNYTYQKAQDYTYPEDCGDGGTYKGQFTTTHSFEPYIATSLPTSPNSFTS